mgnify:CR=1 FL=1
MSEEKFKKIISHAKEYGFIFQSSEIYDGLSAVYDYGQNGVLLKNNIKEYWWKSMTQFNDNIVGIDSAIFSHPTTWKASGHLDAFNDPLIDNKDSKKRYRADDLIEDYINKIEKKLSKEIEKNRKRFGESFDEEIFLTTNDRAKKYNYKSLQVSSATKTKYLNDSFQLIFCWAVFEVLDQVKTLIEMNRLLTLDGHVVLTAKNDYYYNDDLLAFKAEKNAFLKDV